MRSFIKSHRRSQSSGSSDILAEEASNASSTSNGTSAFPPSNTMAKPGKPMPAPVTVSSQLKPSLVSVSQSPITTVGSRSVSDSKVLPFDSSMSSSRQASSSTNSQTNMFPTTSTVLIPSSSSSSLKKLNPITFIKRRRASTESPPEFYIPSAEEYKEAGSIYGTRTHDWGSVPSTTSPVFHPTPVFSSPAAFRSNIVPDTAHTSEVAKHVAIQVDDVAESGDPIRTSSELSLVREDEEDQMSPARDVRQGLGILGTPSRLEKNKIQKERLDLDDLQRELSFLVHESQTLNNESEKSIQATPSTALVSEKTGPHEKSLEEPIEEAYQSDEDHHSEFSFEEDTRIGRNSSVNYHKPTTSLEDHNIAAQSQNDFVDSDDQDYDEYMDEYNYDCEDDEEDVQHLFGTTSYNDLPSTPYLGPNVSLPVSNVSPGLSQNVSMVQVSPLRVSARFSDGSEVAYKDEDTFDLDDEDEVKSFHTAHQPEWDSKSFMSKYEDTFDGDVEDGDEDDFNYDSLLDEVNAVPNEDDDYDDMLLYRTSHQRGYNTGLRKAKSYAFEGRNSRPHILKRQTSVIKVSNNTTITMFSPSPSLSKKSSTSSSGSVGETSSSTSTLSSEHLTSMEIQELTYGSFLKDPPKLSHTGRRASLTPISERSYDSDYSVGKHDAYDII